MDEEVVERVIRGLSQSHVYRFPTHCYRCERDFPLELIRAIERDVQRGATVIKAVSRVVYEPSSERFLAKGDRGYDPSLPAAIPPRDFCCRTSIVSPITYPVGPNKATHSQSVPVKGPVAEGGFDFFDLLSPEDGPAAPKFEVGGDHSDIRLFIEDGIEGFEPPIEWDL